jgi:hypothetical protein
MNVHDIYQRQRDDAFAEQFTSQEYDTFVAMPFSNRGGYPSKRIRDLLDSVNDLLNGVPDPASLRPFAKLTRVDDGLAGAITITDEIIRRILRCHFVIADLTGCNFGVVLETGLALALKPNARVILLTQDDTHSLHFDLKVTNIRRYTEEDLVPTLVEQLAVAARAFEKEADNYIRLLSSQLTPDAIIFMNAYGRLWKERPDPADKPSIWEDTAARMYERFRGETGKIAFHNAARELAERRLMWTDYRPNAGDGRDSYGIHATEFGWRVIERLWAHDPQMRQPADAPTGAGRS